MQRREILAIILDIEGRLLDAELLPGEAGLAVEGEEAGAGDQRQPLDPLEEGEVAEIVEAKVLVAAVDKDADQGPHLCPGRVEEDKGEIPDDLVLAPVAAAAAGDPLNIAAGERDDDPLRWTGR